MTLSETINRLFRVRRQFTQKSLKFQNGTIVKFPEDEGKVYAKVVSLEEFLREKPEWYRYEPSKEEVDSKEYICLLLANSLVNKSDLYIVMPGSALKEVDTTKELKTLKQRYEQLKGNPELKPPQHTEMLLFELEMNIEFLKRAKDYSKS